MTPSHHHTLITCRSDLVGFVVDRFTPVDRLLDKRLNHPKTIFEILGRFDLTILTTPRPESVRSSSGKTPDESPNPASTPPDLTTATPSTRHTPLTRRLIGHALRRISPIIPYMPLRPPAEVLYSHPHHPPTPPPQHDPPPSDHQPPSDHNPTKHIMPETASITKPAPRSSSGEADTPPPWDLCGCPRPLLLLASPLDRPCELFAVALAGEAERGRKRLERPRTWHLGQVELAAMPWLAWIGDGEGAMELERGDRPAVYAALRAEAERILHGQVPGA